MKKLTCGMAAAVLSCVAVNVHAAPLFQQPASTGPLESPGSVSYSFNAGEGAGTASFDITGFRTLDGFGSGFSCGASCDDLFTLSLNNEAIYSAYFALGGAGSYQLVFAPAGATSNVAANSFGNGGVANLFVPLNLTNGSNTLRFAYTGVAQGFGDEAFSISNLSVTGNTFTSPVPEPATWAMMLLGFGVIGAAARYRRRKTKVAFA